MATKNIICEKEMKVLAVANHDFGLRLPIIYIFGRSLAVGQTTQEQGYVLEHNMGAKVRMTDRGHYFLCFRYSKNMESRLHIWRNQEAVKARQEALGDGWRYSDFTHTAEVGDEIICTDGTKGICIEGGTTIVFRTEDGRKLVTGGYFIREDVYYRTDHKSWDKELAEQVERRKGWLAYYAKDFYTWAMWDRWHGYFDDISRALDCGEEKDVIAAICNHLQADHQEQAEAASSMKWLEDDTTKLDAIKAEGKDLFFNHPDFDINLFVATLYGIYDVYYNSRQDHDNYQAIVKRGDELIKSDIVAPLLIDMQKVTHDMLTSDREVASFATTYDIYQKRYANC